MPVQIFQQTTNKYADTEIDANALLRSVQFAVSAPYSALYQIAKKNANGQPVFDGAELVAQPGQGGFQQNIFGIRFKSMDPAHPTTVLCKAFYEDDPIPTGDLASTSTFNTGGQVTPGGSSVQVQKNGVLIGTEPILDFIDAAGAAFPWNLADDVPNTRITITPPTGLVRTQVVSATQHAAVNTLVETDLFAGLAVIPADAIGVNGWARIKFVGGVQNASGAPVNLPRFRVDLGAQQPLDTNAGGGGVGIASGNIGTLVGEIIVIARASRNAQLVTLLIEGTSAGAGADVNNLFALGTGVYELRNGGNWSAIGEGSTAQDTSTAKTLNFTVVNPVGAGFFTFIDYFSIETCFMP